MGLENKLRTAALGLLGTGALVSNTQACELGDELVDFYLTLPTASISSSPVPSFGYEGEAGAPKEILIQRIDTPFDEELQRKVIKFNGAALYHTTDDEWVTGGGELDLQIDDYDVREGKITGTLCAPISDKDSTFIIHGITYQGDEPTPALTGQGTRIIAGEPVGTLSGALALRQLEQGGVAAGGVQAANSRIFSEGFNAGGQDELLEIAMAGIESKQWLQAEGPNTVQALYVQILNLTSDIPDRNQSHISWDDSVWEEGTNLFVLGRQLSNGEYTLQSTTGYPGEIITNIYNQNGLDMTSGSKVRDLRGRAGDELIIYTTLTRDDNPETTAANETLSGTVNKKIHAGSPLTIRETNQCLDGTATITATPTYPLGFQARLNGEKGTITIDDTRTTEWTVACGSDYTLETWVRTPEGNNLPKETYNITIEGEAIDAVIQGADYETTFIPNEDGTITIPVDCDEGLDARMRDNRTEINGQYQAETNGPYTLNGNGRLTGTASGDQCDTQYQLEALLTAPNANPANAEIVIDVASGQNPVDAFMAQYINIPNIWLSNQEARAMINGNDGTPSYAREIAEILVRSPANTNGTTTAQIEGLLYDLADGLVDSNGELWKSNDPFLVQNNGIGDPTFALYAEPNGGTIPFPLLPQDMEAMRGLVFGYDSNGIPNGGFLRAYVEAHPQRFGGEPGGVPDMSYNTTWTTQDENDPTQF